MMMMMRRSHLGDQVSPKVVRGWTGAALPGGEGVLGQSLSRPQPPKVILGVPGDPELR